MQSADVDCISPRQRPPGGHQETACSCPEITAFNMFTQMVLILLYGWTEREFKEEAGEESTEVGWTRGPN